MHCVRSIKNSWRKNSRGIESAFFLSNNPKIIYDHPREMTTTVSMLIYTWTRSFSERLGSTTDALPLSLFLPNLANSRLLLSPLPYPPFSSPRRDVSSWLEGCMSWPETRLRRLCRRRRRFRSRIVIHLLLEIVNDRAKWKALGHREETYRLDRKRKRRSRK